MTLPTTTVTNNISYCLTHFDHLCWPQTQINRSANVSCAPLSHLGVDPTKSVSRLCLASGKWSPINFAGCFYPDVLALMDQSYNKKTTEDKETFQKIVRAIRYIELVGLSISLISVLLSLAIFFFFKSLYCSRTKIHVNLLLAILIQIIARLATYGIQMFQVSHPLKPNCDIHQTIGIHWKHSIFDRICTLVIIFLQFGKTAMFMWMLCEGIHLNNVLTVSVFKNHMKTYYFHILGWLLPFGLTFSWSVVMALKEPYRRCFNNYMHLKYYWIIDGPRYAVMIINVIFLLNIIRVLLIKMKEGSEKQIREEKRRGSTNAKYVSHFASIRKAVKAALFLLPLLGILHILETFVSADNQPIRLFAIYCSVTYLLLTLQGFFCSLLYCFLNAEVRETLSRRFQTTQLWYQWKRYFGKNDQQNQRRETTIVNERRLTLDRPGNHSNSSAKGPIEVEKHRLTSDNEQNNENIIELSP